MSDPQGWRMKPTLRILDAVSGGRPAPPSVSTNLALAVKAVLEFHAPVPVYRTPAHVGEPREQVFVLCSCSDEGALEELAEGEWSEDSFGSVYFPCPTRTIIARYVDVGTS